MDLLAHVSQLEIAVAKSELSCEDWDEVMKHLQKVRKVILNGIKRPES